MLQHKHYILDTYHMIDKSIAQMPLSYATLIGGGGSVMTWILSSTASQGLAILTGCLTAVLLILKIIHEVRDLLNRKKDGDEK